MQGDKTGKKISSNKTLKSIHLLQSAIEK